MKTFLKRLFLEHWQRKLVSLILAVIIWLLVYGSLPAEKTSRFTGTMTEEFALPKDLNP